MDADALPQTGTCDLSTVGRRSGRWRRVEIWYVVVDGELVVTGTPGARDWLANLRTTPHAVIHVRDPDRELAVTAHEVTDAVERRRLVGEAWRLQPWYAEQAYSVDDWVRDSPIVTLTPSRAEEAAAGLETP
jgi:deazaflavin-dependent oxidoreductase (nitroreductase family)